MPPKIRRLWDIYRTWLALGEEERQAWAIPEDILRSPVAHAALLYLQMLRMRPIFTVIGTLALITLVPSQVVRWLAS
jgi:hypothetical protein